MSSPSLPIDALPAWARLNGVNFLNVELQQIDGKGLGLVATQRLSLTAGHEGAKDDAPLLKVPRDLVLSTGTVDLYAKVDQNFRRLLDAAGRQVNTTTLISPNSQSPTWNIRLRGRTVFQGRHLAIPTSPASQLQTRPWERCGFDGLDGVHQVPPSLCYGPYPVVGAGEITPARDISRSKSPPGLHCQRNFQPLGSSPPLLPSHAHHA